MVIKAVKASRTASAVLVAWLGFASQAASQLQAPPAAKPSAEAAELVAPVIPLFPRDWLDAQGLGPAVAKALKTEGKVPLEQALGRPKAGERFVWPFTAQLVAGFASGPLRPSAAELESIRYSQPIVCGMAGRMVVFLERGTLLDHGISGIGYRILPKPDQGQPYSQRTVVNAIAALASARWPTKINAPLRLALAAMPAERQGAASACWNLAFMAEARQLPATFVSSLGGAYRQQVIRALGAERREKPRPHFQVMAYWRGKGNKAVVGRLSSQSSINGQQVILAQQKNSAAPKRYFTRPPSQNLEKLYQLSPPIPPDHEATVAFAKNLTDSRFQVRYPSRWISFLQIESQRLARRTPPAIVARYGTWAYLDRGRGFGITINQRFVGMQPGSSKARPAFAGHVVKFFGASAGLKDARGQLITDGAILYLRSGRDQAVIGRTVFPDQATYP